MKPFLEIYGIEVRRIFEGIKPGSIPDITVLYRIIHTSKNSISSSLCSSVVL